MAFDLVLRKTGFSKEQLKVQMDNLGNLRAVGERPLDAGGRYWSRFETEHVIPPSCDVRGVRARFDDNILYITFPKLIAEKPTEPEKKRPTPEPEKMPPTPEPERKRPTPEPEKKPPMPEPGKKLPTPEPAKKPPTPEPEKKPPMPEPEQKQELESKKEIKEETAEIYDVHGEKEKNGGEAAVEAPPPEKMGIGFLEGIRRPRQVVVNMFVSVIVIALIGIFVGYKLRGGWGIRGE